MAKGTGGYHALVEAAGEETGWEGNSEQGSMNGKQVRFLAKQGDFDIFLLAGRYPLLEQEALETFLLLSASRTEIGIVIGGAFESVILASGPKPGAFYDYEPAPQSIIERVAAIQDVCSRSGVRLPEAALRFRARPSRGGHGCCGYEPS